MKNLLITVCKNRIRAMNTCALFVGLGVFFVCYPHFTAHFSRFYAKTTYICRV